MISYEIAQYFQIGTDLAIFSLSIAALSKWQNLNACQIIKGNKSDLVTITLILICYSILIGFRPLSSKLFGDTVNYAAFYGYANFNNIDSWIEERDWLFNLISALCHQYVDVSCYFTILMLGYVFFALAGIKRFFKNNTYGALLFYIGAFSFFTYATNGVRNGLACAIVVLSMSFIAQKSNRNFILFAILSFIAFSIHSSTALPILCMVASLFLKNTRPAIVFWFISIVLCVVARGPIENFFSGLGFDDRLSGYINATEDYAEIGYKTGFRPDFLLYSFMPILLGMIVNSKISSKDKVYNFLLNTYTLSNSFWVMLMNAAFSNRFAYLSWFMYPIVLAYPCLRMNVWGKEQGQIAGTILLAHSAFTVFMILVYY